MKFAHLADIHLGSWRDQKLTDANAKAFEKAIDRCIAEQVDFVLIAGDFFHTALPPIDKLTLATKKLYELKEKGIPVYIIAGGHDFSASGKTMLNVLEEAGLVKNVCKGVVEDNKLKLAVTIDPKTGIKITGILGRKGMLDRGYYEDLDRESLERERGYKIFMFHTALSEFKPEDAETMIASPVSYLPKGFNYYAGGHVHIVFEKEVPEYGKITYPGPLFPNNFRELEKLRCGGFYLVNEKKAEWIPIKIHDTFALLIDATNKTPQQVTQEIEKTIEKREFLNTIVLIRIHGKLLQGKPSEIEYTKIHNMLEQKGAYFVMRNTAFLTSEEFTAVQTKHSEEEDIIREHVGDEELRRVMKEIITAVNTEKKDGERNIDFENRIIAMMDALLRKD